MINTLNEGVLLRFGLHSSRLLYDLQAEDLPASVVDVLNALMAAGPEATLAKCDLCDSLIPAVLLEAHTVCSCPACREKKKLTPPMTFVEDSQF